MKLLYIYTISIIAISIVFTSCEQLGIEVTTVKGTWKSETDNNYYLILELSENGHRTSTIVHNDSIVSSRVGTWTLNNDTLNIYCQNFKSNGVNKFRVEQISMDMLTLRNITNDDVLVLSRLCSTPQNDYNSRYEDVFDLKKGFWWYTRNIVSFALIIALVIGLFDL